MGVVHLTKGRRSALSSGGEELSLPCCWLSRKGPCHLWDYLKPDNLSLEQKEQEAASMGELPMQIINLTEDSYFILSCRTGEELKLLEISLLHTKHPLICHVPLGCLTHTASAQDSTSEHLQLPLPLLGPPRELSVSLDQAQRVVLQILI